LLDVAGHLIALDASSVLAACSVAPCDRVSAPADICCEPDATLSAAPATPPMTCANLFTMSRAGQKAGRVAILGFHAHGQIAFGNLADHIAGIIGFTAQLLHHAADDDDRRANPDQNGQNHDGKEHQPRIGIGFRRHLGRGRAAIDVDTYQRFQVGRKVIVQRLGRKILRWASSFSFLRECWIISLWITRNCSYFWEKRS
jgi:hypothetical protein